MAMQNGIIGDEFGIDIPETVVDDVELVAEKKAARYSRTREYKRLKEHFESRIVFYQGHLPNGEDVTTSTPSLEDWRVANAIIKEFNTVINFYETSSDIVKDAENL